jgi:hypothetical protein
LHFDADQLRADGLHLGGVATYSAMLCAAALRSDVVVRDVTTVASALKLFAELSEQKDERTFDVIVAVGHSDDTGIQMASDHFGAPPVLWTLPEAW